MLPTGDHVPLQNNACESKREIESRTQTHLLAGRVVTRADLDGGEVVPEVTGATDDEEALAIRSLFGAGFQYMGARNMPVGRAYLDGRRSERARRGIVSWLRLRRRSGIKGHQARVEGERAGETGEEDKGIEG